MVAAVEKVVGLGKVILVFTRSKLPLTVEKIF